MSFPAAIIVVTLLTFISIFGFYKIFLDKPSYEDTKPIPSVSVLTPKPTIKPQTQSSAKPSDLPSGSTSPSTSNKPSPSVKSITILQNNVNNQTVSKSDSSIISGLIDISGTPPSGSSIVITIRKNGTNEQFQTVVDAIKPQDSENWSWAAAENGVSYDMIAVLKGKSGGVDIDYAKSQTYTIKAPAYNQIFIVDVGYALSTPTGTITITCNTHYSNNTWYATVNFPIITGALMYKLQTGKTSGGSDIADIAKNAQTQDVTLNDSVNYYAQYAVAAVSNPTSYQYSAFSSPKTIRCP